jgi:hypothetical protein
MRARSIIAAVGAVALATVAAPAGVAHAAPTPAGVQYVYQNIYPSTQPTSSDPVRNVQADVACPSGYQVTGSGAGPDPGPIMPTGDFTKATVQGAVVFASGPGYVVGELVCTPSSQFGDVTTLVVRDHTIKAGTWHRTTAKCPSGYYAFGGGGNFSNLGPSTPQENGPTLDGQSWAFTAYVPSGASTLRVTTRCAPRTGHNFLATYTSPVASTNPLQQFFGYAVCPPGYQAISGGFHVTNANGTPYIPGVQGAIPIWTIPVPADPSRNSSWYANVFVPPGTFLSVAAQCVF